MSAIPDRDALQPERTALAWQRTAITAMVALVGSVRRRLVQLRDETRGYSPFQPMVRVAVVTLLAATGGVVLGVTSWLG